MNTCKNRSGSAMLWAVCASAVFMIVSAAGMVAALSGYERTLGAVELKQAEYLCRSAIGIASEDIEENGEDSDFFPDKDSLAAKFDFEGNNCELTVLKNGDKVTLTASAENGGETKSLTGEMAYSSEDGWELTGYVGR